MVRVKICGNTDAQQVAWCLEAGADSLGFVVEYPVAVPWGLTRAQARPLLSLVPPLTTQVVVTGGEADHVIALARELMPDVIQLHTDNDLDDTARIARALAPLGIALIRALRIDVATGQACGTIADPLHAVLALQETGIAALLVDARTQQLPAGTGARVDREIALRLRRALTLPLILAGGLTPENVGEAVEHIGPYGVDVISGVEASRGVKSPELIRRFVQQAKGLPDRGSVASAHSHGESS